MNEVISNSKTPLSILSYINNSFKIWIASCNDSRISVINCWFLLDWNFDLSLHASDIISSPMQALLRGVRNSWLISRTKVRLAFKLAYKGKIYIIINDKWFSETNQDNEDSDDKIKRYGGETIEE